MNAHAASFLQDWFQEKYDCWQSTIKFHSLEANCLQRKSSAMLRLC